LWRSGLLISALLAVLLWTPGCGLFEPRDTEEPEGGSGGAVYEQPQEPEVVISNLINVVVEYPHVNYPELFFDDFTFIPDPDDVLTLESIYGQGVFDDWDTGVEVDVGDRLFGRYVLALLSFSEGTITEDTDSTYTVLHEYSLDLLQEDGWASYRGAASFRMRQDPSDNLWYMSEWTDFRTEASDSSGIDGTWGYLKGEIRATT
jgi:hypothetical protein